MPSSSTKTPKTLHLASDLGELNKLASVDLPNDVRNANAKTYCKLADKVYLTATDRDLERDEEGAYVFYMRYFNVITFIKRTKQYVNEKKFFDDMIGTAKIRKSINRAEVLLESLEKRYEDLREQKQTKEKSKEEAKSNKKNSKCRKPNQSSGSDSDSGVGSLGSDLDVLPSGSGVSSSADVYQKLKVSHNTILTPEANSSDNLIGGLELPSSFNKPETANVVPSLTAQNLYSLLEKEDTSNILILDCRPRAMFAANHINRPCCINIPAELLDQGVSVGSIERRLPERTRMIWNRRGTKEFVIIMDESTQVADISPQCRIQRLKDVIFTFDSHSSLAREPLFLDGGFHSWLWHYPSLALKSELPQVSSNSKPVAPVDLSALDYPQLPEEDKAPVAEAQVPRTPKNDSSELKPANSALPGQVDQENAGDPSKDESAGHHQPIAETSQPGVSSSGVNHEQHPLRVLRPSVPQTKEQGPLQIMRDSQPPVTPPTHPSLPSSQTGVATIVPSSTSMPQFPVSQSSKASFLNTQFNASRQQRPVLVPPQSGIPVPNLTGVLPPAASVPQQLPSNVLPSQANISLPQPSKVPPSQSHLPLSHFLSQHFIPSPEQQSALSTRSYIPSSQPVSGPPVQHVVPSSGLPTHQTSVPTLKPSSPLVQTLPNSESPNTSPSVTLTGGHAVNGNSMSGPSHLSGKPLQNLEAPGTLPSVTLTDGQSVSVNSATGPVFASQPSSVKPVSATSIPSFSIVGASTQSSEGSVHSKGSSASQLSSTNTLKHHTQPEHQVVAAVVQVPGNTQMEPTAGGQVLQNAPHALSQGNTTANASCLAHQPHAKPDSLPGNSSVAAGNITIQPESETWPPEMQPSPAKTNTLVTTPGLPLGWEKVVDPANGRVYYKDHNSQTTHWELPKAPDPKPNSVQSSGQTQQRSKIQREPQMEKPALRRSLSSPNLAKVSSLGSMSTVPVVDRQSKPDVKQVAASRPVINRSAKPLTAHQLDNLNPSHGGIGQGLTGLRNLGNTCYMNSVLQCLSGVAPLAAYFISGAYREDVNRSNRDGTRGELAEQFSILICVLHSGRFKCVSPGDFKRTVGKFKTQFSGYDQQDSQELLAFLMDGLQEDLNKVKQKPQLKAPGDDLDPETAANIAWENHKKRSESIMVGLFDGLFMSTVRCLVCQKESYTFEAFSNLTLPLPSHKSRCSLQECLNLFTRTEKMSGDDKWFCPKCQQRREASKQIQIWRLPAILIIHLKRFQYDGMWRQKLQTGVSFPMTQLDMSSFVVGPNSTSPYNLHAVSNHYGTMHGGHYTAFCKSVYDNRWYKFDDQFVTEMLKNDVVTSAGYLLFYTSFDFQPPKFLIKG